MKLLLAAALLLCPAAARAQTQQPSPPDAKVVSAFPTGGGDPDKFTCRPPQRLPDSRLLGPEVCKRNGEWARYRRDGMDVAADGVHDVKLKANATNTCSGTSSAGASTGAALGMRCD
jgi:hypothetical protein